MTDQTIPWAQTFGASTGLAWVTWAIFALAVVGLLNLALLARGWRPVVGTRARAQLETEPVVAVLLFDGDTLADASAPARDLLRGWGRPDPTLSALVGTLAPVFGDDLAEALARLDEGERLHRDAEDGRSQLEAEVFDGALRLTLHGIDADPGLPTRLRLDAALRELDRVRTLVAQAPFAAWFTRADGSVSWANRRFLELADRRRAVQRTDLDPEMVDAFWPEPDVIPVGVPLAADERRDRRVEVPEPGAEGESEMCPYDVTSLGLGEEAVHFAIDARPIVAAQTARARIVQALSLTFAHLPLGVAVFDRARRLVQFNPALVDLTGLSIGFASERPGMGDVLARLREAGVGPSPDGDGTSVAGMASGPNLDDELAPAIEAMALQGGYSAIWTGSDGRSLRVTGCAPGDGSLTLTFDDVTADTARHDRIRRQAEAGFAAIDALDDPVLVFDAARRVAATSARYDAARPGLTGEAAAGSTERDEIDLWSASWDMAPLRAALQRSAPVAVGLALASRRPDRPPARLRVSPLPAGGAMVTWLSGFPTGRDDAPAAAHDMARPMRAAGARTAVGQPAVPRTSIGPGALGMGGGPVARSAPTAPRPTHASAQLDSDRPIVNAFLDDEEDDWLAADHGPAFRSRRLRRAPVDAREASADLVLGAARHPLVSRAVHAQGSARCGSRPGQ